MAKSVPKVEFQFGIKADTFNNNLKELNNNLKVAKSNIDVASNSVKEFGKNSETLSKQYTAISKALNEAKEKVKLYENEMKKTNETMQKNKENLSKLGAEKDKLNQKYAEAVKQYGKESEEAKKLKEELDGLNDKYKEQENKVSNNVRNLEKYNVALGTAGKEVSELEYKLSLTTKAIEENANVFLQAQKKLESAGESMQKIGGTISDVSGKLLAISVPIATAGVAIAKMSMDFETSMASINTLLDDTSNLESYRSSVVNMSDDLNISIDKMTDGLYQVISALGDSGEETENMFEIMAKSAKAGGAEVNTAVSLITSGMKGYGEVNEETAQKISDLAFQTAKLGVTTFPEMASSMQQLFPLASTLNISMEELFGSMATLTGVTGNTAEVSTQLKAVFSNLIKPTTSMAELMEQYGYANGQAMLEAEGLQGVLKLLQNETGGQSDKMGELFSSTEALTAILALSGEQFDSFVSKSGQMNEALGATDKAFEKITNTSGERLSKSLNQLKNSFLEIGDSLAPTTEMIAEKVTKIAEAIAKMDAETVANIVNMAGWGVVLGTAGKAIGGVVTGVGGAITGLSKLSGLLATTFTSTTVTATGMATLNLSLGALGVAVAPVSAIVATLGTAFYLAHERNDALNKSVIDSSDSLSLAEKGFLKLAGATLETKEELENAGIVYKDFNDNISSGFRSAVAGMREDISDFNLSLHEIKLDEVFSEEEHLALAGRVSTALNNCLSAINDKQSEMSQSMNDLFMMDGILDEKEVQLIEWWNNRGSKEIEEATKLANEINEIETTAFLEGRILTAEEENAIQDRYSKIRQIELLCKASNNEEIIYAEQEFRVQVANLDAEHASALLIQRKAQAEEQLMQEKINVETQKTILRQGYEGMSEEDKFYVDEMCKKWDEAYAEKEATTKASLDSDIAYMEEHNAEALSKINIFTGEILDAVDQRYYEEYAKTQQHYDGINKITESGMYQMKNTVTGEMDTLYVSVDKTTGKIVGTYNYNSQELGAMTKKNAESLNSERVAFEETQADVIKALEDMTRTTIDKNGQIVDSNGKVVGSLKDVKNNADGTREGILNLNGQPINIKINADGTIAKLDEVRSKVDNLPTYKELYVGVVYNESGTPSYNGSSIYATGASYVDSNKVALVNESNIGWELVDPPSNRSAFTLSQSVQGDLAYVPAGTRIQTHLSSTQSMKQAVTSEVNKQLGNAFSGDIEWLAKVIVKAIEESYSKDIEVNNEWNITNNTDMDVKAMEQDINKVMKNELRKFGKIK